MNTPTRTTRLGLIVVVAAASLLAGIAGIAAADTLESTSGAVIEGKIVSRDDKTIVMEVKVGARTVQRRFGIQYVRAITIDGKREVLSGPGRTTGAVGPAAAAAANVQRTRQEVEALIRQAGKAPPDWLATTKLSIPPTLDLSWPDKPQGPWNNQKNVGQFIWDVVNPNPGRWREGVKLMHHLMELHPDDADLQARAAGTLGGMYHHLFQDYARAAWWWRRARSGGRQDEVGLAECYWKLGNKAMAVEALSRLNRVSVATIKLWADLGETDRALKLADLFAGSRGADEAAIAAGDACRAAGRTAQAIKYYELVLEMPDTQDNKRSKDRARASLEAVKLFDTLDLRKVPDGAYAASSLGYEAPIEVEVKVSGGRIEAVRVTRHREKQFYSAITDTTEQIVRKQSLKDVDATSRATITSEAIINATAKALHGAMK